MFLSFLFFLFLNINSQENQIETIQTIHLKENIIPKTTDLYKILDDIKFEIENSTSNYLYIENILNEALNKIRNLNLDKFDNFTDALLLVRRALISFYIKTNKYPSDLRELQPDFLKSIPYIKIHSDYGNSIKYVRTNLYDKDYIKAIDSTTEYLYFADPKSSYWGFFIINSTNTFKDTPYYKY